ncbi:MAG TPA: sigma-54-dependent Fis family transcriptional regulator, partial [Myxococcales bacterium]|nr:sigma-54-dependent Fis family transcriptional regulator [Myxococcales bacterium]
GTKEIEVNFRLLTATHRNLTDDVQDGRFRQDLYYRLSVVTLEIPSLRERREDIPLLTPRILHQLDPDEEFQLTHDAQKALQEYLWPGNVRELRNILQRTIALLDGNVIDAKALNLSPMNEQSLSQDAPPPPTIPENITLPSVGDAPVSLKDLIAQTEREILRQMLEKTENVEQAAKLLEISKGWFYNRIKKYDLELPNKKE